MIEKKTFLDTLQTTVKQLEKEGIITKEQLGEGIDIPIKFLYSKGIDRNVLAKAMDNICGKINIKYENALKKRPVIDSIRIFQNKGRIVIEVPGRDDWTCFILSDEQRDYHKKRRVTYFTSEEFLEEMYKTMMQDKENEIKRKIDSLSWEEIIELLTVAYDQKQKENTLKELSISLSEMIQNFGEYYRYLYGGQQKVEEPVQFEILQGGLIAQENSEKSTKNRNDESKDRKSEIYPFEKRNEIFMQLNPLKIISFDSIDEDMQIQKGVYTSYVFRNNRENGGYFLICEPYQGDKPCRAAYLTDKCVKSMQGENLDNSKIWIDTARTYLEMPKDVFRDEKYTYTFNHTALNTYAARMKYIISGEVDSNVAKSVIYNSKMNLIQLFGTNINKQKLGKMSQKVTKEEIDQARNIIIPRKPEQEVGGR